MVHGAGLDIAQEMPFIKEAGILLWTFPVSGWFMLSAGTDGAPIVYVQEGREGEAGEGPQGAGTQGPKRSQRGSNCQSF